MLYYLVLVLVGVAFSAYLAHLFVRVQWVSGWRRVLDFHQLNVALYVFLCLLLLLYFIYERVFWLFIIETWSFLRRPFRWIDSFSGRFFWMCSWLLGGERGAVFRQWLFEGPWGFYLESIVEFSSAGHSGGGLCIVVILKFEISTLQPFLARRFVLVLNQAFILQEFLGKFHKSIVLTIGMKNTKTFCNSMA